jgi:hypothetical protein
MTGWFRPLLRQQGHERQRRSAGPSAPRSDIFRAIGCEQLEGRLLLTTQLVVNTTADMVGSQTAT